MHSKLITLSVIVLQPVAQTIATLAQKKVPSFKRTYKSKHTMTEENIVQENLQLETISPNNLKDRLETLVEEINKKDGEHVIVLVHPKLPNICLQISTKRKRPKKVAVTPHQKKTFCSPRLGRCPHCRKRTDVSKLTVLQNPMGFLKVFGYRGFSRKPQEAQDGSQKTPKKSKTPKNRNPKLRPKIIKKIGTNF